LFCQRLADISQLSVLISHDAEACARGAAMQLLPEMTGEHEPNVIRPQPDIALQDRYRRWTLMMDQLAVAAG
jgi:sugar (pentulose or hexulose) kinase